MFADFSVFLSMSMSVCYLTQSCSATNHQYISTAVDTPTMKEIFVSPTNSSDDNSGTIDSPFATIQRAHDEASAGDTIYLRGGTYFLPKDTITHLGKSGKPGAPIRLFAYQDEQPVLDGSRWTRRTDEPRRLPDGSLPRRDLIWQDGNYWHVKGIEVRGGPHLGYVAKSVRNTTWEDLNIHHNDQTGLHVYGDSNNNLVLGGDFHHNFDPSGNGEDADGIGFKFGSGEGNVIRGARLYNNSDDGIDLWDFKSSVTIEDSWAYGNGVDRWNVGAGKFSGNGNGFKLSGGSASNITGLAHVVRNNMAWENANRGFDYNSSRGAMRVYNNTSYNNGRRGYWFEAGSHVLRNNVSLPGENGLDAVLIGGGVKDTGNSWSLSGVNADLSDFVSIDGRVAMSQRQADGSLPESNFLKLRSGSDLIDAGVNVGSPYEGAAPDLGANEFVENAGSGGGGGGPMEPSADAGPDVTVVDYDFENRSGSVVTDEVSFGGDNVGRLYGGTRQREGTNGIITFDGDDKITMRNSAAINTQTHQQRTVAFRFRMAEPGSVGDRQVLYEEGGKGRGLNAYVEGDKLYVGGWNRPNRESNWEGTWLSTDDVEVGKWHHLAFTLDGGSNVAQNAFTGYLDGKVFDKGEGSQLWSHGNGIGLGNVNGSTLFHDRSAAGSTGFVGSMDSFKIYNSAASQAQLQTLVW